MAKSAEATTTARAPRATPTTSAGAEGDARTLPLNDFLTVPEHRLRDLLAYGMAAEAGHTLPREGVDGLRRAADAELEAHAFRLMHNQAETIRRQAMDEQLARLPRGLSFTGVVAANIVAVALGLALLLAASLAFPDWVASLAEQAAQFLARATIRS